MTDPFKNQSESLSANTSHAPNRYTVISDLLDCSARLALYSG